MIDVDSSKSSAESIGSYLEIEMDFKPTYGGGGMCRKNWPISVIPKLGLSYI